MDEISSMVQKIILRAAICCSTGLLTLNGYFIKGLVEKIQMTADSSALTDRRVAIIEQKLDDLKDSVNRLLDKRRE